MCLGVLRWSLATDLTSQITRCASVLITALCFYDAQIFLSLQSFLPCGTMAVFQSDVFFKCTLGGNICHPYGKRWKGEWKRKGEEKGRKREHRAVGEKRFWKGSDLCSGRESNIIHTDRNMAFITKEGTFVPICEKTQSTVRVLTDWGYDKKGWKQEKFCSLMQTLFTTYALDLLKPDNFYIYTLVCIEGQKCTEKTIHL